MGVHCLIYTVYLAPCLSKQEVFIKQRLSLLLRVILLYYCIEWIIIADVSTYSLENLNYWWYIFV